MDPVVFHPEEKEAGKAGSGKMPQEPATPLPKVINQSLQDKQTLPSLAIPVGTMGRKPKGRALKSFIKALLVTYILLTGALFALVLVLDIRL